MISILLTACLMLSPNQFVAEHPNVKVVTTIDSHVYTYEITNLNSSPICGFSINEHSSYDFKTPKGWDKIVENGTFNANSLNYEGEIAKNTCGKFSLRVSSYGAVLGKSPLQIKFKNGDIISIPNILSPTAEPKSYIYFVFLSAASIIIFHSFIFAKKTKI